VIPYAFSRLDQPSVPKGHEIDCSIHVLKAYLSTQYHNSPSIKIAVREQQESSQYGSEGAEKESSRLKWLIVRQQSGVILVSHIFARYLPNLRFGPATTLTSTWCRLGTCEYCCSKYLQS